MKFATALGNNKGFSIPELLIVIVVIGILTAIGIVSYGSIQANARDNSVRSDAESVESEITRYSTKNAGILGSAVEWYSPDSANPNIQFVASEGNIIDVVASSKEYCVRVYNPRSSQYKTLDTALTKGSSSIACDTLDPSQLAVDDSSGVNDATNLTWTGRSGMGIHDWSAVASSADGTRLVAAVSDGGYVYTSSDSGETWTARTSAGSYYWTSLASSADGSKIIAAYGTGVPGSYLQRSDDYGQTWEPLTGAGQRQSWGFVESSADGSTIYAGNCFGNIRRSKDSGATWVDINYFGNQCWSNGNMAVSTDGAKLVVQKQGDLFTSDDSGDTWTRRTFNDSSFPYYGNVASSADGSKIVATAFTEDHDDYWAGELYYSSDSGATWNSLSGAGTRDWNGIAISSNGKRIVAGVNDDVNYSNPQGKLYASIDSGASWQEQSTPGGGAWRAIAMSSNGLKIVAGSYYSTYTSKPLFTGVYTP